MNLVRAITVAALFGVCASPAMAQQIIGATSATINSGGPGFGSINDTRNQAGLSANYVSGVTNYNTFVATTSHDLAFSGNEWFSNSGVTSASVTYDLGSVFGINAFALWNEDAAGIGSFNLLTSLDGITFISALTASPTNTPNNTNYLAQSFGFGAINARYARLDMSACPQQPALFDGCAIGEVAFRTAAVNGAVPEPATWAMMLFGFGAIGVATRRRKTASHVLLQAA